MPASNSIVIKNEIRPRWMLFSGGDRIKSDGYIYLILGVGAVFWSALWAVVWVFIVIFVNCF